MAPTSHFRPSMTSLLTTTAIVAVATMASGPLFAQEADEALVVEEMVVTGTRSKPRSASQSPVPIDTFDAAAIERQGGDMVETIKTLVPSFNATPMTGDGSAFIRSTSMRGLPPDEVLVLVNSKRRHRSALIAHFGAAMNAGAHAVDIGMIPSIALKNVEILRDGAAAQYGSDAIAGVMNFIMRDASEGGSIRASAGQYYGGETEYKISANIGLPLGDSGFINFSAEYQDIPELDRGMQWPAAIGVPGVEEPVQKWGGHPNDGIRTSWNGGLNIGETTEIYFFGNLADTTNSYNFFWREPWDEAGLVLPINPEDPSEGNFCYCEQYPAGFTPRLFGKIRDFSQVVGFRGEADSGLLYDISGSFGSNKIDYTIVGTVNQTFGPDTPTTFDPGDLKEEDTNFNADFSYPMQDNLNVATGMEWREESYTMWAGEDASWMAGPWAEVGELINPETGEKYKAPSIGSNGMEGAVPESAGTFNRSNWSAYLDVEYDISDDFLLQGAVRYEDFSDFGGTTNFKVAARYNATDNFTIRGAVSTGFRAPTPGQSNYTGVVTTFDGATGEQTQQGTISPTDPLAIANGGAALGPEDSTNYSIGFTTSPSPNLSLTVDVYRIEVTGRIVKTQDIPISDNPRFSRISFYTNSLETRTQGLDIVATYSADWDSGATTDVSLAYNYNDTKVVNQVQINGINPFSATGIRNLETNLPDHKASLTVLHTAGKFTGMVRTMFYGGYQDERGQGELLGSEFVFDVEASYDVNEHLTLTLGANNALDNFPDEIMTRLSQGQPYPRRSAFGYRGGKAYVRGIYRF